MATTTHTHEITNTCTCQDYNPDTDEYTESNDCWGDCWEQVVYDFAEDTKVLRESNTTGWWKVSDLQLWDRTVSGYFYAKNVQEILYGMTVRSAWTMRYTAYEDRVEYSLSHHDAMGSASTLTAVSEEDVEELGLY